MIDLYTWPTPNGHKVHIMLEETGLEYRVHPIDIGAGDQFKPEFLAISPNNKIPAMVDQQGPDGKRFALAESGAMLFYLASKTGKFLPRDLKKKWQVMQWVMTQMGHVGPMLGQAHHFLGPEGPLVEVDGIGRTVADQVRRKDVHAVGRCVGHRSSLLHGSLSAAGTRFESKLAGATPQGRTCTGRADSGIEKIARGDGGL